METYKLKIDELGRIFIPVEFRRHMDLKSRDFININIEDNSIVIKKAVNECILCNSTVDLKKIDRRKEVGTRYICRECILSLNEKNDTK